MADVICSPVFSLTSDLSTSKLLCRLFLK